MTKANLIDHIAETTQLTKHDAERVVEAVLGQITEALAKGEKVDLRGFGSFQANGRIERQGRNPKTGETITIAARTVAVFKPSKDLAERVNQSRRRATKPPPSDAAFADVECGFRRNAGGTRKTNCH